MQAVMYFPYWTCDVLPLLELPKIPSWNLAWISLLGFHEFPLWNLPIVSIMEAFMRFHSGSLHEFPFQMLSCIPAREGLHSILLHAWNPVQIHTCLFLHILVILEYGGIIIMPPPGVVDIYSQ
jgi:hypothetical protein